VSVLSRILAQNKTGQNRVAYTEELVSGLYRSSQHKRTPFPTVPRQLPVPNFILFFVSFLPPASKVLHLGDKRCANHLQILVLFDTHHLRPQRGQKVCDTNSYPIPPYTDKNHTTLLPQTKPPTPFLPKKQENKIYCFNLPSIHNFKRKRGTGHGDINSTPSRQGKENSVECSTPNPTSLKF
jgi:hypothetical protein